MDQHLGRALVLVEQSRYDLAEQELRLALAAEPDNALAHAYLAQCLSEHKELAAATARVRPGTHFGAGNAIARLGHWGDAKPPRTAQQATDRGTASTRRLWYIVRLSRTSWTTVTI